MERDGVYYDEDTGNKLVRPSGYNGLLYQKVTNLHKQYLKALGNIGVGKLVYYDEWIKECQNIGVKTKLPPGTMTHGVFESRGYIGVQKDAKTKLNLYRLTDKGKGYLEGLLSQD